MEHTERQCVRLPGVMFKRDGRVWACFVCHRIYVLSRENEHGYPEWIEIIPRTNDGSR
jgi:hypothetical protein